MHFFAALLYGLLLQFQTDKWFILKIFQRAYEGPYPKEDILLSISNYLEFSNKYLDLENNDLDFNLEQIFNYLSVNETVRDSIDISLSGPLKIFIPVGDNRYFIDYAWLSRIFYTLFWKINPSDQNFKGLALEKQIQRRRSILTTKQCKSIAGTNKQIDASFEMGGYLIIVECRAKGRSFGFDKGDIQAIQMRESFINDSLADIDEKAKWLLENPIGLNYDISNYKGILPVLVSPFVEFIPSLQKYYWIDNITSRVMTPSELEEFLSKTISDKEFSLFNNIYWNTSKLIVTG